MNNPYLSIIYVDMGSLSVTEEEILYFDHIYSPNKVSFDSSSKEPPTLNIFPLIQSLHHPKQLTPHLSL